MDSRRSISLSELEVRTAPKFSRSYLVTVVDLMMQWNSIFLARLHSLLRYGDALFKIGSRTWSAVVVALSDRLFSRKKSPAQTLLEVSLPTYHCTWPRGFTKSVILKPALTQTRQNLLLQNKLCVHCASFRVSARSVQSIDRACRHDPGDFSIPACRKTDMPAHSWCRMETDVLKKAEALL
jgi:hypothetical protein